MASGGLCAGGGARRASNANGGGQAVGTGWVVRLPPHTTRSYSSDRRTLSISIGPEAGIALSGSEIPSDSMQEITGTMQAPLSVLWPSV